MLIENHHHINSSSSSSSLSQPSPSNKPIMSLSAYSIQGKRNHMEDFFDIGYKMKPLEERRSNEWPYEYFYFGIFDGHGGVEAAKFAKKNLLKFITEQKTFWSNDDKDVMQAIKQGFADTHSAMREVMPKWSRTGKTLPSTAGTTASVLFIRNGKFYTGHVGDSRIVIAQENNETKQWIADQLTEDHKPESEKEIERIEKAGGQVRDKTGVQRVVWRRPVLPKDLEKNYLDPTSPEYNELIRIIPSYPIDESLVNYYQIIPFLAIARSLGDFWSINPYSGEYIVSPEPDVSCRPIRANDKSIVLASDGLWNVMDAMKAVRFLQELEITKKGSRKLHEFEHFISDNYYDVAGDDENHAESLVYFAYQIWERKRLRSDNITVVVAMLNDILPHFHKSNKTYATRSSSIQNESLDKLNESSTSAKVVQIEQTSCYMEKIRLDVEPTFEVQIPSEDCDQKRERLECHLILPPTILEKDIHMEHPKNYTLLSNATCRVISRDEDLLFGENIKIKTVSDDPADLALTPAFTNVSGKKVRNTSAQVSDCLHDFGQPWCQLKGKTIYENKKLDMETDQMVEEKDEIDDTKEIIEVDEPMSAKDESKEETAHELWLDEEYGIKERTRRSSRSSTKPVASIPQLRCLLNYTPTLDRSRSRIYRSRSENMKRKNHVALINTSISKNKRRKSQPIRCNPRRT